MGHGTSRLNASCLLAAALVWLTVFSGTNAIEYEWKTGLWGECLNLSCGRGGTQTRGVWCDEKGRTDPYHSVPDVYCSTLQKPKLQRMCFKYCDQHVGDLRWSTTVWSKCMLKDHYSQCALDRGFKNRTVSCVWVKSGYHEEDYVCTNLGPKPASRTDCELKCPQDCIVSQFKPISSCDTCKYVNRTRMRELVVPPAHGGAQCPALFEMIPCFNCTNVYSFNVGRWDDCEPFDKFYRQQENIPPEIGIQRRTIQCLNNYGISVRFKQCSDSIKKSPSTDLSDEQTCIIPQDCLVSEWSSWQPVNTTCVEAGGRKRPGFMLRTRTVLQIPRGTGRPCPQLEHYFQIESSTNSPCPKTHWINSSWSECRAPPGGYQCTTGLQTRSVICVEEDTNTGRLKPVHDRLCHDPRPLTSQVCRAHCDIDCVLSQWTEWTECKVTDCELYLRRRRTNEGTGQRYRTRKILTHPDGQGQVCEHLSETQMCDPQPCYSWNMTVGQCRLLHSRAGAECGLGIAHRTIACTNKLGLRVSDSLCLELQERPDPKEDCTVWCPSDCILSDWSEWTDCPNLCQEGQARPGIRNRYRTILARPEPRSGGAPCPPNRQLEEIQNCPTTIECAIYAWQTDPWGKCEVQDAASHCGRGVQKRDVKCYNLRGHLVTDQRCALKVKPADHQFCDVPCPQDCILTEFTEWSDCSATCWEGGATMPVQHQMRYILVPTQHGGKPCPHILTNTRKCTHLPLCREFFYEMSPWSNCVLPMIKCGNGIMARNVTCKGENGTVHPMDICIRHVGPIPPLAETCHVSCEQECSFTDWTPWSSCVIRCNGKRFRTRKVMEPSPGGAVPQRCRDRALFPLDQFEQCLCDISQPVAVGNWSECVLEPERSALTYPSPGLVPSERAVFPAASESLIRGQQPLIRNIGASAICGPGKRYKVLACRNGKGEMEGASRCSHMPYEEEVCVIPCPVDCVMSDWSQWGDCSTSCGIGTQIRYRHIRQNPSDGGRRCPSLDSSNKEVQTRVCKTDCMKFVWRAYNWVACSPLQPSRFCGNGTQSRTVRCESRMREGFTGQAADISKCYGQLRPLDLRSCYLPCRGECVVSDWSEWSQCKQPCHLNSQTQMRRRTVLRQPVRGSYCPDLEEERPCIRGNNCAEYQWKVSDWTSCLVNQGVDECGIGNQERYPVCLNHFGQGVDVELCEQNLGPLTEHTMHQCQRPCDVDCLLTEWSSWTECSNGCGLGNRVRQRAIVQEPMGNGRVCPTMLQQEKPCYKTGCYKWVVSPWSQCTAQAGICGHGIQRRNITCTADGKYIVNTTRCAPDVNIVVTETVRSCQVPCPGECVITGWTEWNECFINCLDFEAGYTRGVQARTRSILSFGNDHNPPCPEQLWESRPCNAERCYSFQWAASDWDKETEIRSVWCQRSDGLVVTGGCSPSERLPTVLSCDPPCTAEHSFCNDTDTCACEGGKVYRGSTCVMDTASNDTVTPVSSISAPSDSVTNVWMYAVVTAGTVFVIFVAVGLYSMSEFFHKGPRPRKKDDEKSEKGLEETEGVTVLTGDQLSPSAPGETVVESHLNSSCNHVKPVPVSVTSDVTDVKDVDSVSIASADRSPNRSPDFTAHRRAQPDFTVGACASDLHELLYSGGSQNSHLDFSSSSPSMASHNAFDPSSVPNPASLYASVNKHGRVVSHIHENCLHDKCVFQKPKPQTGWYSAIHIRPKSLMEDIRRSQSDCAISLNTYSDEIFGSFREQNGPFTSGTSSIERLASSEEGFGKSEEALRGSAIETGPLLGEDEVDAELLDTFESNCLLKNSDTSILNSILETIDSLKGDTTDCESLNRQLSESDLENGPLTSEKPRRVCEGYDDGPEHANAEVLDVDDESPYVYLENSNKQTWVPPLVNDGQMGQSNQPVLNFTNKKHAKLQETDLGSMLKDHLSAQKVPKSEVDSDLNQNKKDNETFTHVMKTDSPVCKQNSTDMSQDLSADQSCDLSVDINRSTPMLSSLLPTTNFGSLDTDHSTSSAIPSTSVSIDSLQSEGETTTNTSDLSMVEEVNRDIRPQEEISLPVKNIAMNSIKRQGYKRKSQKQLSDEMADSGVGMKLVTNRGKKHHWKCSEKSDESDLDLLKAKCSENKSVQNKSMQNNQGSSNKSTTNVHSTIQNGPRTLVSKPKQTEIDRIKNKDKFPSKNENFPKHSLQSPIISRTVNGHVYERVPSIEVDIVTQSVANGHNCTSDGPKSNLLSPLTHMNVSERRKKLFLSKSCSGLDLSD